MRSTRALILILAVALPLLACTASSAATRFRFSLDKDCTTSAGVYTPDGRAVRMLWGLKQLKDGTHREEWDGLDDLGHNVPPGDYEVRVACSNASYTHVGTLGNSGVGEPMQAGTDDLIIDRKTGEIYTANNWEEAGQDFRKMDANGKHLMDAKFRVRNGNPNGWPIAVAVEGGVLYCSVFAVNEKVAGQRRGITGGIVIRKFTADTGAPLEFPTPNGYIRVREPDPTDDKPFDHQSAKSIVICGDTIVLADRYKNNVFKYDKNTGAALGEFAMNKPFTIVVDAEKRLWIANDGNKVTVTDIDGKVLAQPEVQAGQIACIRLDGKGQLWLADQDAGKIRVYKIESIDKLTPLKTYGRKAKPGEFGPLEIGRIQSFDVMPDGGFVLGHTYGRGAVVARFSANGQLLWQQVGLEFCTNGTYDQKQPDLFISSLSNAYRLLDPNSGAWRFEGCMYQEKLPLSQSTGTPRILQLNNRRFYFALTGDVVKIFRLDGRRMVPATVVGLSANGWLSDLLGTVEQKDRPGHYVWHDASGDGLAQPEEIIRASSEKSPIASFSCEVDQAGNLIIPNHHTKAVHMLPLSGFDDRGNPLYDWSAYKQILPRDDTLRNLQPMKACPLPDGSMYVLQRAEQVFYPQVGENTPWGPPAGVCWMGGWVVSKYDPQGKRLFTIELPDHCTGMDWIPNVGRTQEMGLLAGCYNALKLFHYSPDGLLLGVFTPKMKTGWLDHNGSISINRNPNSGLADLFAEESLCNRISWHRIDDRDVKTLKVPVRKQAVAGEQYADEAQLNTLRREAQTKGGPQAVELLTKALDLAAEHEKPLIHLQLGQALRNTKPEDAAKELLLATQSPRMDSLKKAELLFDAAGLLRRQRKFEDAIAVMDRVVKMDLPADRHYAPRAMVDSASIYMEMGKPDEALEQSQKAIDYYSTSKQQNPGTLRNAWILSGDALRRQDKHAEAAVAYEQSLKVEGLDDNSRARSETLIAECCLAMDDPAGAAEHFIAAAQKYPKASAGTKCQSLIRAGEARLKSGDKDAARKLFQAAIDLPDAPAGQKDQAKQRLDQLGN